MKTLQDHLIQSYVKNISHKTIQDAGLGRWVAWIILRKIRDTRQNMESTLWHLSSEVHLSFLLVIIPDFCFIYSNLRAWQHNSSADTDYRIVLDFWVDFSPFGCCDFRSHFVCLSSRRVIISICLLGCHK